MVKRFFDIVLSSLGLIVLLPVFLIIVVAIKLDSKGSIFFKQRRVGLNGELFLIHKFRTMVVGSESLGSLTVGEDSRVTRVGGFLRKSKFDELPQLFDVFFGAMSIVGPRPEVPEFVDCYPEDIKNIILSVRPGITDKASIEMVDENEILAKYPDPKQAYINHILPLKMDHYVDYVKNNNIWGDIVIIFRTVFKIINRA